MAKKKRKPQDAQAPSAKQGKTSSHETSVSPVGVDVTAASQAQIDLCVRAIQWVSKCTPGEDEDTVAETLLVNMRPLIVARAAKYEEDAKAGKAAQTASNAGNVNKGKVQALTHVPQVLSAVRAEPLSGSEVTDVIKALKALAAQPDELLSKMCKPVRSALHPLVEANLRERKASLAFQITCMIEQRSRWAEALTLLAKMRALEALKRPKLGAYQRWIRELNVAEGTPQEIAMLDAVLRVAAGLPPGRTPSPPNGSIVSRPPFTVEGCGISQNVHNSEISTQESEAINTNGVIPENESTLDRNESRTENDTSTRSAELSPAGQLFAIIAARRQEAARNAKPKFGLGSWSVISHEAALERKPPNHFDLDIYTCAPGVLKLEQPPNDCVKRHPVPSVEGAFVLSNVLSIEECESIRTASEAIGYRPDVPLSSKLDERAANVVLFATEEQNDALFARVKDALPQELEGHNLLGLNRRWRLYRYKEGNLYRKHLDGAWPASGVRTDTKGRLEYLYDAYGGNTRSRLTFIVYLNDDFEGGATTFFVPRHGEEGTLDAQSVRPRTGNATVFPHGECPVPLLHEGSSVTKGCKYLLRTDVVYASPTSLEGTREAARLRALARKLGIVTGSDAAGANGSEAVDRLESASSEKANKRPKVLKRALKGGKKRSEVKSKDSDAAADEETGAKKKTGNDSQRRRRRHEAGKHGAKRKNTSRKNVHWHH